MVEKRHYDRQVLNVTNSMLANTDHKVIIFENKELFSAWIW